MAVVSFYKNIKSVAFIVVLAVSLTGCADLRFPGETRTALRYKSLNRVKFQDDVSVKHESSDSNETPLLATARHTDGKAKSVTNNDRAVRFERIITVDPKNFTNNGNRIKFQAKTENTTKNIKTNSVVKSENEWERDNVSDKEIKPAEGTGRYLETPMFFDKGKYDLSKHSSSDWKTRFDNNRYNVDRPASWQGNAGDSLWTEDQNKIWRRRYPSSAEQQMVLSSQQQEMLLLEILGEKTRPNKTADDQRGFHSNLMEMLGKSE